MCRFFFIPLSIFHSFYFHAWFPWFLSFSLMLSLLGKSSTKNWTCECEFKGKNTVMRNMIRWRNMRSESEIWAQYLQKNMKEKEVFAKHSSNSETRITFWRRKKSIKQIQQLWLCSLTETNGATLIFSQYWTRTLQRRALSRREALDLSSFTTAALTSSHLQMTTNNVVRTKRFLGISILGIFQTNWLTPITATSQKQME